MTVKEIIAKEISRQSNEYGSLMISEMPKNRDRAMFYHSICHNLNRMAKEVFKLEAKHF